MAPVTILVDRCSPIPQTREAALMLIRPYEERDLPAVVDLTIETFRPFYEDYVHPLMGDEVFAHQHGRWEQDYRDDVPLRHDPAAGRHAAVAVVDDQPVGWVSWQTGRRPTARSTCSPWRRRSGATRWAAGSACTRSRR
jgi:hypothetical protein